MCYTFERLDFKYYGVHNIVSLFSFYDVLSERAKSLFGLPRKVIFSIYSEHLRDGYLLAAHPCENNISAALRIPLCRLYGLTEVGYRVLVPGPDPMRVGIPISPPQQAINILCNHCQVIAAINSCGQPLRNQLRVSCSDQE